MAPVAYNTVFRMALGCPVSWKTAEKVVRAVQLIDGTRIDIKELCRGEPGRWAEYLSTHPKAAQVWSDEGDEAAE